MPRRRCGPPRCSRASGVRSASPIRSSAHDLGFFVYWLPFETALYFWAMLLLLVVIVRRDPPLRADAEPAMGRGARSTSPATCAATSRCSAACCSSSSPGAIGSSMYRLLAEGSGPGGTFTSLDHRVTVPATLVLALDHALRRRRRALGRVERADAPRRSSPSARCCCCHSSRAPSRRSWRDARSIRMRPTGRSVRYQATRLSYTRRGYGIVERDAGRNAGRGLPLDGGAERTDAVWDASMLRRFAERERDVAVVGTGAGWSASASGLTALLVRAWTRARPATVARSWSLGRFDGRGRRRARSTRPSARRPVASATRP